MTVCAETSERRRKKHVVTDRVGGIDEERIVQAVEQSVKETTQTAVLAGFQ